MQHLKSGIRRNINPVRRKRFLDTMQRMAEEITEFDPVAVWLQPAVTQLRHIQQILDETVQPLPFIENILDQLLPRLSREVISEFTQAGGGTDN
jgi:hypothetical protein